MLPHQATPVHTKEGRSELQGMSLLKNNTFGLGQYGQTNFSKSGCRQSEVQKDSQACEQTVAHRAELIEAKIPKYLC